jgi:DNA-binding NarL/FixJ family response regulator
MLLSVDTPLDRGADSSATAPRFDPLSPAELRVLTELRRGLSNKGIAAALVLSPRTVESHISNLLAKTGCRNRIQLVLWALGER